MNSTSPNARNRVVEVTDIHENTAQEVIQITVDRLKLVLVEHKDGFERRKEWHTPLSLIATIAVVLITTSFRPALGFSADTWAAVFIVSLVLSGIWFIRAARISASTPKIEDVVEKMKSRSTK